MDIRFTEEQEMLRKTARDFLSTECPMTKVRELEDDSSGHSPELWQKMAELGWLGLIIPEEYEGMGMSFTDLMALIEEMGRNILPGPFIPTMLGALTIVDIGSDEQKTSILPEIAQGNLIITPAFLEEEGSIGPSGTNMEAVLQSKEYILNGTKMFVENAHVSDYLICAARIQDSPQLGGAITLLLVDAKSPGIKYEVIPTIAKDKLCQAKFQNVTVPAVNVLGQPDQGWAYLMEIVRRGAIARSIESLGGMQACVDMTVAYTKERVQYGRPIGAFQALQHIIADMWTATESSRYLAYETAWLESEGLASEAEASMVKAYINEAYKNVSKWAIRLHGGIGTSDEHDISRYYRRAKAADIAFGGTDFHREIVAREIGLTVS